MSSPRLVQVARYLLVVALFGFLAPPAFAAPVSLPNGVVVHVQGVGVERARGELVRAIPGTIPIVRTAKMPKHPRESLGGLLMRPARRRAWLRQVRTALTKAGADGAFILYLGPPGRRGHEERLLLVRADKPDVPLDKRRFLRGESPEARVARWSALIRTVVADETPESAVKPAAPEAPIEGPATDAPNPYVKSAPDPSEAQPVKPRALAPTLPKPAAPVSVSSQTTGVSRASRAEHERLEWIVATVALEWGARFFRHYEPATQSTRSYTARAIPSFALGLDAFPFTASDERTWQNFSVGIGYASSVLLTSQSRKKSDADNSQIIGESRKIATRWYRYNLGFTTFIPFNATQDTWGLRFGLGYANWVYTFDAPSDAGQTATASYHMLRPQGGVEVRIDKLQIQAGLTYLYLLSIAKLGQRKPEGLAFGVDTEVAASLELTRGFRTGLGAAFAQYFYKLEPIRDRESDPPGKVRDRYLRLNAFAQFAF